MKNKSMIFFSVLALFLLLASGCSKAPTGGAVSGKETVKVGVLAALTGSAATIGESSTKAIELAAEEFNAKNNDIQIRLVIEDTKCDGAISAKAANKLVNVDKVEVIIGALCSGATVPAIPIAENNQVVMFSPCSSAPSISGMGDYIFRTTPSDSFQGTFVANHVYNELGKRNAAIIYSNTDWGFGVQSVFAETFEKLGGKIVAVESVERESQDLRAQITKANSKNPDLIYAPLYSQNMGLLAKQSKELGIDVDILGADAAKDPNLIVVAGDSANGLKFVAPKSLDAPAFEKRLKQRKGVNVELCTPFAYDAANIMFEGIEKFGSDSEKIKDYLYGIKGYDGVSGTITIDGNGDRSEAEYSVFKVVNGEFVMID